MESNPVRQQPDREVLPVNLILIGSLTTYPFSYLNISALSVSHLIYILYIYTCTTFIRVIVEN